MQRNSTKHGPRLDEEMKPAESRVEEWREQEDPADGEPVGHRLEAVEGRPFRDADEGRDGWNR